MNGILSTRCGIGQNCLYSIFIDSSYFKHKTTSHRKRSDQCKRILNATSKRSEYQTSASNLCLSRMLEMGNEHSRIAISLNKC